MRAGITSFIKLYQCISDTFMILSEIRYRRWSTAQKDNSGNNNSITGTNLYGSLVLQNEIYMPKQQESQDST